MRDDRHVSDGKSGPVPQRARQLFAAGRTDAAKALLRQHIDSPQKRSMLRDYLLVEGRIDEASDLIHDSNDPVDLGLANHLAGRYAAAATHCQVALDLAPDRPDAILHLARARHNLGEDRQALALLERLVANVPEHAPGWQALAHARRAGGDLEGACQAYERALTLFPGAEQLRLDLALTRLNLDDAVGALDDLESLLAKNPDHVEALIHAGLALHLKGALTAARRRLERALELAPDHPDAHRFMAAIDNETGDAGAACRHLEQALQTLPEDPELLAELAAVHELSSDLNAARQAVVRGLRHHPRHPRLNLESARIHRRQGNVEEAVRLLRKIQPDSLPPRLAQQYFHEVALSMDRLDQPDQVMQALDVANRIKAQDPRTRAIDRDAWFARIDAMARWLESPPRPVDIKAADAGPDLCFLVGFPRSGTTLLDTLLDAHPAIASIEEKPTFERLAERLANTPQGYPAAVDQLDHRQSKALRSLYRDVTQRYLRDQRPRIIVDKLHLRLLDIAAIRRLFPAARFLCIHRHPCDVVLSNYMQLYEPTEAFVHCDTLENTVRFYDATMRLWPRLAEAAGDRLHAFRYEDLVADPHGELQAVCRFLDVDWRADMTDTGQRTRRRGRIRTNSYHQVAEAIYRRSSGRWQRYRAYLAPYLDTLDRHARQLGYAP